MLSLTRRALAARFAAVREATGREIVVRTCFGVVTVHYRIKIEVKAIGLELKESHTKQGVDYAANQGVDWVVLTNGSVWRIYRVIFAQPISQDLVFECDMLSISPKNRAQVEGLFLLAKEGQSKSVLHEYHAQRQAMSRHYLGALILEDTVLDVIRRELRRLSPDVKIDRDELRKVLTEDVLKREVTEGDKADEARRKITKSQKKTLRAAAKVAVVETSEQDVESVVEDA